MAKEDDNLNLEDLDVKLENEDDELDELTGEEDDVATPANDKSSSKSPVDLEAKLAELEASNRGLVKSLSAQRNLRQDLQAQLDGIKTALHDFRTSHERAKEDEMQKAGIPIDFDEKGNPYLDPENLGEFQNAKIQELEQRIQQLQYATNQQRSQATEQEILNNLLSQKEGYSAAYKEVTKAWNFLKDDVFDDYLVSKNIPAPKTAEQAIEIAINAPEINKKFIEKFPDLDMESILEAHLLATPRYLRKALDKAIKVDKGSQQALNLNRPASLATANSTGGENYESLLSRVADMSPEEFQSLDKRTMDKIDRLLAAHG